MRWRRCLFKLFCNIYYFEFKDAKRINKKITIDLTKDILDFNQISKLKNIPSDNYHNMTLLSHLNCSTPLDNKPTNTQIISIIKNIDTSSLFNGNSF